MGPLNKINLVLQYFVIPINVRHTAIKMDPGALMIFVKLLLIIIIMIIIIIINVVVVAKKLKIYGIAIFYHSHDHD